MREKLKSPFCKLRNFALSKTGPKVEFSSEIGEFVLTEGAEDMHAKFEGFLANGQIISGAAYDFSRSLQDMASYMMETFGDIVDQETGNIFSLLAKVQFEMSKLLDDFAAHVSETIIKPTETIMDRIQQAVIMKHQYDAKIKAYIVTQMQQQNRKSKRGKGNQASQPSIRARESFKEQANALNLYMQSLKQGQSESLVTQVVKYHSAQMHLFSKGLASINAVEPMMRQLALNKVINRRLPEEEVSENGFRNSRGMEGVENSSATDSETNSTDSSQRHILVEQTEPRRYSLESFDQFRSRRGAVSSKSAPISPVMHHKRDGVAKESSFEGAHIMYALPSPYNGIGRWVDNKTGTEKAQKISDVHMLPAYYSREACKPNRSTEGFSDAVSDGLLRGKLKDQFVETQQQRPSYELKVMAGENLAFFVEDAKADHLSNISTEKCRRYSQSGPLIDSAWSFNNSHCANVRGASSTAIPGERLSPLYKSGPISRSPMYSYTNFDLSPPPSIPQISELHKLPLPPTGTITPPKSPSHMPHHVAYSAPLGKIGQEVYLK